jgi:hypothetical protein
MRFKEDDAVHRLVLWAYLQTAQTAPFEVVLTEWSREPERLVAAIHAAALKQFPKLKRCKCTSQTATLNAFAECVQSSAVRIAPMFFTTLPLWLINTYVTALNKRPDTGSSDTDNNYKDVLLAAGDHIDGVRLLHRFMLNVLFARAHECLIVQLHPAPVLRTMNVYMHRAGLRCNATNTDGVRCGCVAELRCGRCKRAFYCSFTCKRADTMHADECDTARCGCKSSIRGHKAVKRGHRLK